MDGSRSNLTEAKKIAALGWPVIPERDKIPLVSKWPETASTVPAVLERWWREHEGAGIGVLTGPRSGLAVLDVDPRNGGNDSLEAVFPEGLPETPRSRTGGGGQHIFFRYPLPGPIKSGEIMPGLEIKADGGKVTVPPSVHPNGKEYEWAVSPFKTDLAPLPQVILGLVARRLKSDRTARGEGEPIPQGQRNNRLAAIAGAMRRQGMGQTEIEAAILTVNESQCKPPLPEREVLGIARSVGRYKPDPQTVKTAPSPKIFTGAELQRTEFKAPKWAVPGLIPEGLSILAGSPKTGKSFFSLAVAAGVAYGGAVLGSIEVEPGEVLALCLEDTPRRIKARLEQLFGDGPFPEKLHVCAETPRADQGGIEFIEGWLEEHPNARLVIVDTFQKFRKPASRNGNIYGEDYAAAGLLKSLADRHQVGIVAVHHTRKGEAADPLEMVSGSMGLTGSADTIMVLKRARGQNSADFFLTGRDVEEKTLRLRFDELGWIIEGEKDQVDLSGGRRAILGILKEAGGTLHYKDIAAALNRPEGTIKSSLSRMSKVGQVISLDKGKYTIHPNHCN